MPPPDGPRSGSFWFSATKAGSNWVTGNVDRLIKLTTNGLMGPIVVNGKGVSRTGSYDSVWKFT